jgi:hypothetical protein
VFSLFFRHLNRTTKITPLLLGLLMSVSTFAFDYPLTTNAIRDAYFLGRQNTGAGTVFLPQYSRTIPNLAVEPYVSRVQIETPFFQAAQHASAALNYSAQDAVTDFYGKTVKLRIYLEVCYRIDAPLPSALKIRVLQRKKEIPPLSDERTAFFPPSDAYGRPPNLGEKVTLEFDPSKFDSSTLTVQVDTPEGQRAKIEFEMETLR